MATRAQMVAEFRSIPEQIIGRQVETARSQWLDMENVAHTNGLTFVHYMGNEGPLGYGDPDFERWAVIDEHRKLYNRAASLAVLSCERKDESLIRTWTIASYMGGGLAGITVERELKRRDEISAALTWAQSPHLAGGALGILASLTRNEKQAVENELKEDAQKARKLQDGLNALSRQRSRSLHRPLDFRPRIRG